MLDKILNFFKNPKGTRTLKELAEELGTEPSALEGMLDFLVKKGKLKVEYQHTHPGSCENSSPACIACPSRGRSSSPAAKYYYLAD
ncbi:MAG: FeoC-like transcriptional regulator [Actinomycetota bacterium]